MQKNFRDLLNFVRFIAARFDQDRFVQIAASLTFTTLLSLVPLITIILAMFSAFPVFDDFSNQIKTSLINNLMPDTAGKIITQYMRLFAESAMHLTAVVSCSAGDRDADDADHRTRVQYHLAGVASQAIVQAAVIYWVVLTLAPPLIGASLSLTSWLVGLSMGYAKQIPVFGVGSLKILPVIFTTLAFAMLYQLVPNSYVPRKHAWIGAAVAAIVFETMNRVFGYYISNFFHLQAGVWRVRQCADFPDVDLICHGWSHCSVR